MQDYFNQLSEKQKLLWSYAVMFIALLAIALLTLIPLRKQQELNARIAILTKQTQEMQVMAKAMNNNPNNGTNVGNKSIRALMLPVLSTEKQKDANKLVSVPMNEADAKKLFVSILLNVKDGKTEVVSEKNGFVINHYLP